MASLVREYARYRNRRPSRHPGRVPGSNAPQTPAPVESWMPEPVRHDDLRPAALIPAQFHRQLAIAMNEARRHARRLPGHVHAQPPLRHFLQQDVDLQLGQPRADAAGDAVAEREMTPRIGSRDDDHDRKRTRLNSSHKYATQIPS